MSNKDSDDGIYSGIALLVGFVTFFGCWIYSITASGFIIGVLFGWIPSLIVAFLAGILWPILAIIGFFIWRAAH